LSPLLKGWRCNFSYRRVLVSVHFIILMAFLRLVKWSLVILLVSSSSAHSASTNSSEPSTTTVKETVTAVQTSVQIQTTVQTATHITTALVTPTTPSTTSTIASSSTSASPTPLVLKPGQKNPKRGLAFAAGTTPADIINANQTRSVISWVYDWADTPPDYLASSNIPYVPMQWGSVNIEKFPALVAAQGAKVMLGFNEPDFASESNISPTQAAQLWIQYIQPLRAQGIRLGAPAVTADTTGAPWLINFMEACTNCTFDFIPLHWYGSGTPGFYSYIWSVHTAYPTYPIWITEYAEVSANNTVVEQFLNDTIIYLDSLDWIERYAWFGFFRPEEDKHYNLLDANGGLNALGQIYVGADTIHTGGVPIQTGGYKTVNGADNPSQGLVTAWPSATNAASGGWSHPGDGRLPAWSSALVVCGCMFGAFWVLW